MESEQHTPETIEQMISVRARRLNIWANAISMGAVVAIAIFAATIWLVVKGGEEVGPHLSLLGQYFIGYRVSLIGSLIGAAYGLLVGGLMGALFAWVYNTAADFRDKVKK